MFWDSWSMKWGRSDKMLKIYYFWPKYPNKKLLPSKVKKNIIPMDFPILCNIFIAFIIVYSKLNLIGLLLN